jgi:hypothetical protein
MNPYLQRLLEALGAQPNQGQMSAPYPPPTQPSRDQMSMNPEQGGFPMSVDPRAEMRRRMLAEMEAYRRSMSEDPMMSPDPRTSYRR